MNIRRIGAAALAALLAAGAVAFANSYNNQNGSVTPGVRLEIDGTGAAVSSSKPLPVQLATSDGLSTFTLVALNSNNSTSIKASAGQVYEISVYNKTATIAYLKIYNKASAPTCGTDIPVEVHMIPASTSGAAVVIPSTIGAQYALGIGICVVTGIAASDNTSVAASSYIVNIRYK